MKQSCCTALALLLLFTPFRLSATDEIPIDESRPLAQLVIELVQRYGYLVTYEEAPYDESSLRTDVHSNGVHFRYPSWNRTIFHIPNSHDSGVPVREIQPLDPTVVESLLKQHRDSGNPGSFGVTFGDDYAHIIPSARVVNGTPGDFQPVLSTRIPFPTETRSCNEALRDLFFRIKIARGVNVVGGTTPIGALIRHQCTVVGSDLTAREVLSQILDQVGTSIVPNYPKSRFSWALMYDVNWDTYFLSTILVPAALTPQLKLKPAQPKLPGSAFVPTVSEVTPGSH